MAALSKLPPLRVNLLGCLLLLLHGAVAGSMSAHAGLVFQSAAVEKDAAAQDAQLVYQFPFEVSGQRAITIKEIKALCDCLSITTDRKQYRPGDRGVVTATLQLGSLEGTIAKNFNLVTDDPKQGRLLLRCVANIPPVYAMNAQSVRWRAGTMPEPATVSLRVLAKEPIRVLKVTSTRENVSASFREVKAGREYEIILKPDSTERVETGLVSIETDCPIKKYSRKLLYFHILPGR